MASNASVQVMLFADRLEVWNPGELPPGLTLAQLRRPHASIPHNPLIAEPMFLTRYAEKAGSGILDMLQLCREVRLPEPEFRQDGGQFVQTMWRPSQRIPEAGPQTTEQVEAHEAQVEAHEAQVDLSTVGKTVLRSCADAPKRAQELLTASGYSSRTGNFKRSLDRLLALRLIEMTIADKPRSSKQRYRLTQKGRKLLAQIQGADE